MPSPLPLWVRLNLLYLIISNIFPGLWAAFWPQSFYDTFPHLGLSLHWVAGDGPFNQHLVRDVGFFFLSMSVLPLLALLWPRLVAVRAVPWCLRYSTVCTWPTIWSTYTCSRPSTPSPVSAHSLGASC